MNMDKIMPGLVRLAYGYAYKGALIHKPERPHLKSWPWYIGPRADRNNCRTLRDACMAVDRAIAKTEP